jgi:calcium-translocating P-type ATPase
MHISNLPIAEALASLKTSENGLSAIDAERRLNEFGPNRIEEIKGRSLWIRFLLEFTNFFALILWVAAGLAFFAESRNPGEGMAQLGIAILCVILINGFFSFWQEYRAEQAISALRKLLPQQVKVRRDGQLQTLAAEQLVPGDLLVLEEGDNVPADCRLIQAVSVRVNTSTITGESLPKARSADAIANGTPLEARNLLLAGTALISGQATALVYATGMHSEFGKIAHLTQTAGEPGSPLQREIARLSRLVAVFAGLLGLIFFAIGMAIGLPFWDNLMFAIGIIVANVPEGLLPTVTLSLAMATQRMAKRNALVRHLPTVETLGSTTVICSDKTGTLTQNRMSVTRMFSNGAFTGPDDAAALVGDVHLLRNAQHCHNLKRGNHGGKETWLGDPMEVALAGFARKVNDYGDAPRIAEIPFDAERRRMSVVVDHDGQRWLYCKGAPEVVVALCNQVDGAGGHTPLNDTIRRRVTAAEDEMAGQGLRVLAFAYRQLHADENLVEQELVLSALIGLQDPPRPEVPEAIERCRSAGIKVIMVTGDHPHTAVAIGRKIGLVDSADPVVVQGEALRKMSPAQLQIALDSPEILFTRVTAEQKMLVVQALKNKGHTVAVTGDGVNDAPALKSAHIGIAMGSGTDVAKEAADMILLDDNFASIVNAVEEGRAVFENIRKFLTYILTSNIPELIPYLAFVLFRIPLPLTIIQILAVDLGTDMLPALALGAERPDPGLMRQPPRPANERLLSWPILARAYLWLGMLEATVALAAFFYVLNHGGWHYGEALAKLDPLYLAATTACLAAIVIAQIFNVFVCRHPRESALNFKLTENPLLLLALAAEVALILAIVYTPLGNLLFGTRPLDLDVWLFMIPLALGLGVLEESRKWLVRRNRRTG